MAKIADRIKSFNPGDYVNMKLFLLVMVAFLILTLLISSAIVFFSLRNTRKVEETVREQNSFVSSLDNSIDLLRAGDFLFPEQDNLKQTAPHLQRVPRSSWSQEEVDRYWIDPSETGIGEISEHNRSLVEKMLEDVP